MHVCVCACAHVGMHCMRVCVSVCMRACGRTLHVCVCMCVYGGPPAPHTLPQKEQDLRENRKKIKFLQRKNPKVLLWKLHSESHREALGPYIFTCKYSLQKSGSRPLLSTTLPMLGPHEGSSWLFCCRSVWWRSCNFKSAVRSLQELHFPPKNRELICWC